MVCVDVLELAFKIFLRIQFVPLLDLHSNIGRHVPAITQGEVTLVGS